MSLIWTFGLAEKRCSHPSCHSFPFQLWLLARPRAICLCCLFSYAKRWVCLCVWSRSFSSPAFKLFLNARPILFRHILTNVLPIALFTFSHASPTLPLAHIHTHMTSFPLQTHTHSYSQTDRTMKAKRRMMTTRKTKRKRKRGRDRGRRRRRRRRRGDRYRRRGRRRGSSRRRKLI